MSRPIRVGSLFLAAAIAAATGCGDVESATELNPEGPPRVRQVFMFENVDNRSVRALAFGSHDEFAAANSTDDGQVVAATVAANSRIRIVMDELLMGNYLEQIECRAREDLGVLGRTYQSVPEVTTPDDIARCAMGNDILASTCRGPGAVCLMPDGTPLGVQDANNDGGIDSTRFCLDSNPDYTDNDCRLSPVRITCTPRAGGAPIQVPISDALSYWQPSGNQQVPASGGFDALGPAVVLVPPRGLPTSSDCGIEFDGRVVDKDHNRVCAPEGGLLDTPCTPGDTSRLRFGSEILRVVTTSPANNATGVALTGAGGADPRIIVAFNAPLRNPLPASAFALRIGDTPVTDITVAPDNNPQNAIITVVGGYEPETTYTLDISGGVVDSFGVALPEDQTTSVTFTTRPAA
jgi:hypothetical protein